MTPEERKATAVELLKLAAAGTAHEAVDRFLTPDFKHHNPDVPAGTEALTEAMRVDAENVPNKQLDIKHVLAEGELVTIHFHVVREPGDPGVAVVHLYRFEGHRIAELWDIGREVPTDSPNEDGMF
ncbi:MAG: nuclear transport factor 2 family protein [Thermoplasmata archaeon]